jgi:hypothetical protein
MENQWPIRKNSDYHKRKIVAAITLTTITKVTILIIAAAIIASPLLLLNGMIAQAQLSQSLAGTTFPPPVLAQLEVNLHMKSIFLLAQRANLYLNQKRFQYQLE